MGAEENFVSLEEVDEEQGGRAGGGGGNQTYNQEIHFKDIMINQQQRYMEHDYWGDISMEAVTIQMVPVREESAGYNHGDVLGPLDGDHHKGEEKNEEGRRINNIEENLELHLEVEEEKELDIHKEVEMEEPPEEKVSLVGKKVKTEDAKSKNKSQNGPNPLVKRKQKNISLKQEGDDEEKDDCPLCTQEGRLFSARQGDMAKHFYEVHNIMEQGYECTECGFKIKERKQLVEHINVTHRQLKFCCDLCDYQTKYRNRVKSHKVTVHRVGGLPCASCDYTAPEIWVLTQHRRAIHKDFGDKEADVKYKCNYCDYQATQKSHLKSHAAALHQQLVFCCDMCDFQSKWKSRMMAHTRAKHMGIFLFCDHCEFKTVEKHSLKVHIKKKHDDIQFSCFSCDDNYLTRIELRKHMSDVHYMQTL